MPLRAVGCKPLVDGYRPDTGIGKRAARSADAESACTRYDFRDGLIRAALVLDVSGQNAITSTALDEAPRS